MKDFSSDPDFLDLIAAWHENREFSEEREKELLERLEGDPELRRELAREIQMAALTATVQRGESRWLELEDKLSPVADAVTNLEQEDVLMSRIGESEKRERRSGLTPAWWLGMSAAAAVLVLGMSILLRAGKASPELDETPVARVIRIDGAGRTSQGRTLSAGGMLRAGEKLTMERGLVEMAFLDTGVHVVATAPLSLTAGSRERIFVHDGEVKLHVPPQGVGFVVETMERKITDLGTSFVVTARESGSKVLVLDGKIAVGDRSGGRDEMMHEGDRADFDRSGAIHLRSGGPSGVPELTLPPMALNPGSLSGRIIAFGSRPPDYVPGYDVIGARLLPLVRSGFRDESCLAGMKQVTPLPFTGIAGTYDHFPDRVGLTEFDRASGWQAWYHGEMKSPAPGRYRFRGYADNHLLVSVNGKPVFEGSRYDSRFREDLGIARQDHPSLPCLNARAGFASGEWFEMTGEPVRFDLLFGEQSGAMTSGLLVVEQEGAIYEETSWGQPRWPLFLTEPPSEAERIELRTLRRHMERKLMGSFSIDLSAMWLPTPNF